MHLVKKENKKIALKFGMTDIKEGLSFFSENNDFIQVGAWRYEQGKNLLTHIHNFVKREINRTQEFILVVKGSVKASIYDDDENFIEDTVLNENEGLILFSGGHGYEILEDDTVVIEVKNGPYVGAELDRRRLKEK
jgi:hypothetical protein